MTVQFRNTHFWGVAASLDACPNPDRPEVVLSGKSNVGKSSLINALADNKKLAKISSTPGKTRLVIYFDVDGQFYLTDLPGYGYAQAPKAIQAEYSKLVEQYFVSGRPIALVLHLIDIRHKPSKEDMQMFHYMNNTNLPYFTIFTKADKLSRAQATRRIKELKDDLEIKSGTVCFAVSADKKTGLDELRQAIEKYLFEDEEDIK